MVTHKDFESNCKRIAKDIMRQVMNNGTRLMISEVVSVFVSSKVLKDLNNIGCINYQNEINKHLKGCEVTYTDSDDCGLCSIDFDIDFDDNDPEFEDW